MNSKKIQFCLTFLLAFLHIHLTAFGNQGSTIKTSNGVTHAALQEWGGFSVDENGYANTEGWLGWIATNQAPWLWNYTFEKWIFAQDPGPSATGVWAFITRAPITKGVSAPSVNPSGGNYSNGQLVTLSSSTSGSSIRYTVDGSTPSSTVGTLYTEPFYITSNSALKVVAYKGSVTSTSVTEHYSFTIPQEVIIDNHMAELTNTWTDSTFRNNYYGPNYTFIESGTGDFKIRWRPTLINDNYEVSVWLPDGDLTSRAPDAPFTVYFDGGSQTYLVNEQGTGGSWIYLGTHPFIDGSTGYVELTNNAGSTYTIADAVKFTPTSILTGNIATPQFSVPEGRYVDAQTVAITDSTSGVTIRYTLDGSTPSSTVGDIYSAPIQIEATTTLKAIAYLNALESTVTTATYTIDPNPLYGARGIWPSDTPAADANPTATLSSLNELKTALRTAKPGDVFHLTSFNQTTGYEMKDPTALENLDAFGPDDLNVLVRPAPGAIVDLQGGFESFLPNITWAYFKLNGFFAFRIWSDHSRLARIQMGPTGKLSVTASSYHEFIECLKPVRGEDGDTMQVTSMKIKDVIQDTPRDILWDSCWLEGNTVVSEGQHSDTIQWLASDGTMWFRNCYIGPAGNNATFQMNLTFQPSGLPYAVFDLDTVFMGGAEIYGNGNVFGAFHTPAILRRVEYVQITSRGDPFVLPAIVEECRFAASNPSINSALGGGTIMAKYPNNQFGVTVTPPTFIEPEWWD